MTRKIIIDTDPGKDDAVAILLALAAPEELEILGIVAVGGNVPVRLTERNARQICELAGRPEIPVFAGCAGPILRPPIFGDRAHGADGLGGLALPEPAMPSQTRHGVDFLVDALRVSNPGEITLCALGPLTDIALALLKAPDIAERVRELVVMGGAYFEHGNVTPCAEFNIHADPHAADLVLRSGVPVTMIPLDATHQALSTTARVAPIRGLGNRCGGAIADLLALDPFHSRRFGETGLPLHDPLVIAWLLRPDLFRGRDVNVAVEITAELTLGMTVVDWWGVTGRPANAKWLHTVDADRFYDLLADRITTLP